jgi:saccharopine dehydrogenase-like NADP-dependent oxidoreductase
MMKRHNVLIFGDGRIAQAMARALSRWRRIERVQMYTFKQKVSDFDLLVGALPGSQGEQSLRLALQHRKPLLDITDIDPPFYRKHAAAIKQKNITVVPECGFSPGLVNVLLGQLLKTYAPVTHAEVSAGSLTHTPHTFPFLWCFEDLMAEHRLHSGQLIKGRKTHCPPFGGYRQETFWGLAAESYFCASGFEQMMSYPGLRNLTTRVVRPRGYQLFYEQLKAHGFLDKQHFRQTQAVLESQKYDNTSFARLSLRAKNRHFCWEVKSFSSKRERLNSMQKITVSLPVVLARWILDGEFCQSGLVFPENLVQSEERFQALLQGVQKNGVDITIEEGGRG